MKILVLCEDYPNNEGKVSLMYVHTRNLYYQKQGLDVNVISFSAETGYTIDGVKVIALKEYKRNPSEYNLLIIHAPNLRHHLRFLLKYGRRFDKYLFFFHGHEVLKINSVYPQPYDYMKNSQLKSIIQDAYDDFKLFVWRHYIPTIVDKSWFVFVSNWMLEEFEKWTKIQRCVLQNRYSITYNGVGEIFEKNSYNDISRKKYDFITVRNNLDGSKYAIDVVSKLALGTPEARFLVIGKGDYYKYNSKPKNITWINTNMSHKDIISYLDLSRFALMPTRTDAQGLMMCEMAAFGIPVITTDIPVCHEVFNEFKNVYFISNTEQKDLKYIFNSDTRCIKDNRFYKSKTMKNELDIIKRVLT